LDVTHKMKAKGYAPAFVTRLGCVLIVSGLLLCQAGVAVATTAPSGDYTALVRITNKGLKLFDFVGYNDAPFTDLVPTSGPIPRGVYMSVTIVNDSGRAQRFTLLGKTSPTIGPGHKGHLDVTLTRRGHFSYGSTLEKGASFHGVLTVY
jgi:hypothetical protein